MAAAVRELPRRLQGERISLRQMLRVLGDRSTPLVLLAFAIPAIVPTPGVPAGMVFGTALALIALQIVAGVDRLRLPRRLERMRFSRGKMVAVVDAVAPRIERLERRLRARWTGLTGAVAFRLLGAVVFLMAVLVALPIPFGNTLPGLAVFVIALGLARRDGVAVSVGLGLGVAACLFTLALLRFGWALVDIVASWLPPGTAPSAP